MAFWDISEGLTSRLVLGALIDAGLEVNSWLHEIDTLDLGTFTVRYENVNAGDIRGVRVDWLLQNDTTEISLTDLIRCLSSSNLPDDVKNRAMAACRLISSDSPEKPTVGIEDAIFIIAAHLACHHIGLVHHRHSPFILGTGIDRRLSSLLHGKVVMENSEGSTPITVPAAAFLLSVATEQDSARSMKYEKICCGVDDETTSTENSLLRLHLCKRSSEEETEELYQVEATIDDMNPELYPPLLSLLRERGACDAWLTPAVTRTGRPASTLVVLIPRELLEVTAELLFSETTTIGIRYHSVARITLPRREDVVQTSVGVVKVKTVTLPDGTIREKPDLTDCVALARAAKRSVNEVRELILRELEERRHMS